MLVERLQGCIPYCCYQVYLWQDCVSLGAQQWWVVAGGFASALLKETQAPADDKSSCWVVASRMSQQRKNMLKEAF